MAVFTVVEGMFTVVGGGFLEESPGTSVDDVTMLAVGFYEDGTVSSSVVVAVFAVGMVVTMVGNVVAVFTVVMSMMLVTVVLVSVMGNMMGMFTVVVMVMSVMGMFTMMMSMMSVGNVVGMFTFVVVRMLGNSQTSKS